MEGVDDGEDEEMPMEWKFLRDSSVGLPADSVLLGGIDSILNTTIESSEYEQDITDTFDTSRY